MKLTLAFGLQYDTNRPASVYALSVGGERPVQAVAPAAEVVSGGGEVPTPHDGRWYVLIYNLHGMPVRLPPQAVLDRFV